MLVLITIRGLLGALSEVRFVYSTVRGALHWISTYLNILLRPAPLSGLLSQLQPHLEMASR